MPLILLRTWKLSSALVVQKKSRLRLNEFVIYEYNTWYLKDYHTKKSTLLELKISSRLCSILHLNGYGVKLQFDDFFCIKWQYFKVFTKYFHEIPVTSFFDGHWLVERFLKIFIFTLLCGASKDFMKAFKVTQCVTETPQRSL